MKSLTMLFGFACLVLAFVAIRENEAMFLGGMALAFGVSSLLPRRD